MRMLFPLVGFFFAGTIASAQDAGGLLSIPVRVHLMQSSRHPTLQTTLAEANVRALWSEVNSIWAPASIRFDILSVDSIAALDVQPQRWLQRDRTWVKSAIPPDKLSGDAINVCFVRDMGPNGFYYGGPVVVSEASKSYQIRGGAEHAVARVAAHELGHALTLLHRTPKSGLMASGSSGIILIPAEIKQARAAAAQWIAHFTRQSSN